MALPTLFAAQTLSTGAQLDANFAALGAITVIPCTISGTNIISLTPLANTPTVNTYAQGMIFGGVMTGTNTAAVNASVGGLASLGVWIEARGGAVRTRAGDMAITNYVLLAYDPLIGGGSGGFYLLNPAFVPYPITIGTTVSSAVGVTLTGVSMTGGVSGNALIVRTGAPGAPFSDTTDTAAAIFASMPGAVNGSTFLMTVINGTGQTQTLLGGTGVSVPGTATTANGTVHTFRGIITDTVTPLVVIYG